MRIFKLMRVEVNQELVTNISRFITVEIANANDIGL